MKTVLLPRQWNSPSEPPETSADVLICVGGDSYYIGHYFHGEGYYWLDGEENPYQPNEITGWAAIVQS